MIVARLERRLTKQDDPVAAARRRRDTQRAIDYPREVRLYTVTKSKSSVAILGNSLTTVSVSAGVSIHAISEAGRSPCSGAGNRQPHWPRGPKLVLPSG
jgi:hypothetical protein